MRNFYALFIFSLCILQALCSDTSEEESDYDLARVQQFERRLINYFGPTDEERCIGPNRCKKDEYCVSGKPSKCVKKKPEGSFCFVDHNCLSDNCKSFTCRKSKVFKLY